MFEALNGSGVGADEWVWAAWQADLTVRLHAQVVASPDALAALSLKATDDLFVWAKVAGDSFPSFAKKIAAFMQPHEEDF